MRQAQFRPVMRRARERDAADIARLWRDLFNLHAALDPIFALADDGEEVYRDWIETQFDRPDTFFHVVEVDGRVVAFCQSQIKVLPPMLRFRRIGLVADMVVDAPWRGRGIGRLLYAHVEARLLDAGVDRIELKTSSLNAQSNDFWQRACGFSEFLKVLYKEFPAPLSLD